MNLHAVPVRHIPNTKTFIGTTRVHVRLSILRFGANISGKRSSFVTFGLPMGDFPSLRAIVGRVGKIGAGVVITVLL